MNKGRESGFTLIELMVALVLVGLIVAVLAGAVRTGLLSADMIDKRVERTSEVRAAHGLIRRRLETALPVSWSEQRAVYTAFEGAPESLAFVTVMPPWPGRGGPHLVRLAKEGDTLVIIRRITSGDLQSFDFSRHAERTVLVRGVNRVRFAYFGPSAREEKAKWQPTWTKRSGLPRLVRLGIEFADGDRGAWPELVVPLMIGPAPR